MISRDKQDADALPMHVFDGDKDDQDFIPGTRKARPGHSAIVSKKYNLRRREETSVSFEVCELSRNPEPLPAHHL